MNSVHLGSDLDEFLREEGLLADVEATALKRVIAFQIAGLMEAQHISKAELARRMGTIDAVVEQLLDPASDGATLTTLERTALALGRRLLVELV